MKRYVVAGASSRALGMYARPLVERFRSSAELAGIYDPNTVRARYVSAQCGGIPVFADFDAMLRATRPDTVIVLTVDRYHHEYIIRALEAGCDAITEKPMTVGDAQVRAILAAEKRTGRTVTVTFNYRYAPYVTRVKELLRQGAIGPLYSVDFEWLLDTRHGADYFRRWHRRLENSGGLFVHKATHHFDLLNWWVEDEPERVFAQGALRFYGPTRAERGERCLGCPHAARCEFYVDYAAEPTLNALYFQAEGEDGYYRDQCIFSDQIDIYDTMSASVRYRGGAQLTYSLIAHAPYEGWRCAINGRDGRLEAEEWHSGARAAAPSQAITLYNRRGERLTHDIPKAAGNHSGGDDLLLQRLFSGRSLPDPLGHAANSWAGAMSVLIGVAANKSVKAGGAVEIAELLRET